MLGIQFILGVELNKFILKSMVGFGGDKFFNIDGISAIDDVIPTVSTCLQFMGSNQLIEVLIFIDQFQFLPWLIFLIITINWIYGDGVTMSCFFCPCLIQLLRSMLSLQHFVQVFSIRLFKFDLSFEAFTSPSIIGLFFPIYFVLALLSIDGCIIFLQFLKRLEMVGWFEGSITMNKRCHGGTGCNQKMQLLLMGYVRIEGSLRSLFYLISMSIILIISSVDIFDKSLGYYLCGSKLFSL